MSLAPDLSMLSSLGAGLAAGLALGRWSRRRATDTQGLSDLQQQIEALTRAQAASQLANAELRQALDQMEAAAGTDRLTGLWNRRHFEAVGQQMIALSDRRRDPLSLILFDLDHFKRVNDTFGHPTGDAVLKSVSGTVRQQLRASDVIARWGGEEFIVLCPGSPLAGATVLAEKIRKAIEGTSIPQVGMVTISLGLAQYHAPSSLEACVARADEALYRAKERGRNCTEVSLDLAEQPGARVASLFELVWDGHLECGHPEIDHQHQQIFELSNRLLSSITSGRYPEDAQLQMQLLMAHVAQHFHDEEAILAETGFQGMKAHAAEHGRLIAKAKLLQAEMGGGSADLPAILSFLALDLVKGHLETWDQRFFKHVSQTYAESRKRK